MSSGRRRESSTPRALKSPPCAARTSTNNCYPLERSIQILRILTFHLVCSNRGQSGVRSLRLLPDRKSVGQASVEEIRASPCPRLARVHVGQRDGKESCS